MTDKGLSYLPVHIEDLDLSACFKVQDRGIKDLSCKPNLKKLSLSSCYKITDKALELLSKPPLDGDDSNNTATATTTTTTTTTPTTNNNNSNNNNNNNKSSYQLRELDLTKCTKVSQEGLKLLPPSVLVKMWSHVGVVVCFVAILYHKIQKYPLCMNEIELFKMIYF